MCLFSVKTTYKDSFVKQALGLYTHSESSWILASDSGPGSLVLFGKSLPFNTLITWKGERDFIQSY